MLPFGGNPGGDRGSFFYGSVNVLLSLMLCVFLG